MWRAPLKERGAICALFVVPCAPSKLSRRTPLRRDGKEIAMRRLMDAVRRLVMDDTRMTVISAITGLIAVLVLQYIIAAHM